jgi:MFS family permease
MYAMRRRRAPPHHWRLLGLLLTERISCSNADAPTLACCPVKRRTRQSGDATLRTTAILACCTLTYAVSQTMVIPALPQIQRDFGSTAASTAWVMSAFFIASAIFTGVMGRLGDMFGKRRVLLFTLLAYGAGAALSAIAINLPMLVAGRVIMGSGAGMVPLGYAIARDELPVLKVSRGIGTIAMMIGLGAGIGMILGGVLVDSAGWHASFVLAAMITLVSLALVAAFIPESPVRSPAAVDWAGAGLLAVGLGGLLLGISRASYWGWSDSRTVVLLISGLAVLVALLAVETRKSEPLLHVPTLRMRPVLFTNVASLTMGAGQVAVSILIVQVAQLPESRGGLGLSATHAGLLIIPYSLTMVAGSQVAGRSAGRIGGRGILAAGAATAALGLAGLAVLPISEFHLWALAALSGLGISMTLVAAPYLLAESVPLARTGEANGLNTIARAVGQGVGTQLSATVLAASVVGASTLPTASGYSRAFGLAAGLCFFGVIASLAIARTDRSVKVAPSVDAHRLPSGAVAPDERNDLFGDIVAPRRSAQQRRSDTLGDALGRKPG